MKKLPKLIFDKSREGKIGYSFSETEFTDDLIALDRGLSGTTLRISPNCRKWKW